MIEVVNRIIPFNGFKAMTIWPFIFSREKMNERGWRHERIHGRQQLECLLVFFYLIYILEAVFKKYENISFEREAYQHEDEVDYLKHRAWFKWVLYLF